MKNFFHPTSHKSLNFQKIRNLDNEVIDTERCTYIHNISVIVTFYWYGESLFDMYVIVSNRSGLPQ